MRNRYLLWCGIVGGPLFITSSLLQAVLREGFDLRRHHLSTLALGDFGWVQTATFATTGVLMLAFAAGLWRIFRVGALCFGLYGLTMILGAVFPDQPAFGFPPGADAVDSVAAGHVVAAVVSFLAEVAACLTFAWRYWRQGRIAWAAYSAGSGVVAGIIVFTMDPTQPSSAVRLVVTCLVTGAWMTAVAVDVYRHRTR